MYSKILIIPYFGKFPNYFQLFLNSCAKNEDYNFLIFTDNEEEYKYPSNVKVIKNSFLEIQNLIRSKFDFKISLEKPYKLCDFKPAYGYIFYDYIKEYDFWGYCDVDIILGKINEFITNEILEIYDKIFIYGHFTLYKSDLNENKIFMTKYYDKYLYKKYLSEPYIFGFDELYNIGINEIYESLGLKIYSEKKCADLSIKDLSFKVVKKYDVDREEHIYEKNKNALFIYENGRIKRYYKVGKNLKEENYMYIHLQKRKMKYDEKIKNQDCYKIIPNSFEILEMPINLKNFEKIKKRNIDLLFFRPVIKYGKWKSFIIKQLKRIIRMFGIINV